MITFHGYYYEDADSDGDLTEPESTRRSNYLALRGPIRVGGKGGKPVQTKVPSFEPKTESDKKFLAFINRQNSNSAVNNKISLWDKAGQTQATESPTGTNWTRKFGRARRLGPQPASRPRVSILAAVPAVFYGI